MLPTIQPGSVILTKTQPNYYLDDIVSYDQTAGGLKRIVVHRIIGENERGFIIKGDNNPKVDPSAISLDKIRGKVIFATPYVGKFLEMLRDPIMLLVLGGVTAIFQMGINRRKKKNKMRAMIRRGYTKADYLRLIQSRKKPKKPDYSLFWVSMVLNVIIYGLLMFFITKGVNPQGDMITGFLFETYLPSFASTLTFAFYTFVILGLFLWAKTYYPKKNRLKSRSGTKKAVVKLLLGEESNPRLVAAQLLWLGFVFLSFFHLMAMAGDLMPIIRNDFLGIPDLG